MSLRPKLVKGCVVASLLTVVVSALASHYRYGSPYYANLSDQCYSLKIGTEAEWLKLSLLLLQAGQAYPGTGFDFKANTILIEEMRESGFHRDERTALCNRIEKTVDLYGVPR